MKATTKLWIALGVLALLSPLGLLLPKLNDAGPAWGEWNQDELKEATGQVPEGLARLQGRWKSPLPDYSLDGEEGRLSPPARNLLYVFSAFLGIGLCALTAFGLGKFLSLREKRDRDQIQ